MTIDSKEFKKRLIDDDLTMKRWALENGFDIDRLRNILEERVIPRPDEVLKLNQYIAGA